MRLGPAGIDQSLEMLDDRLPRQRRVLGKRYVLPNARVLVHQPHGGAQGQSVDMELAVAAMVEMRRRMVDILVAATGQTAARIATDVDRDVILRGDRAVGYGLVDSVIERPQLADPMAAAA